MNKEVYKLAPSIDQQQYFETFSVNCNEERLDNMMTWPPALQTFMINLSPVNPQAEYVVQ